MAYVDGAASAGNTACTQAAPCQTIAAGLAAAGATRPYLVIAAGSYSADLVLTDRTLTIVGYGANVTAASNGPAIAVGSASADVAIWGLTISGSPRGVECFGASGSSVRITLGDVLVTTSLQLGVDAFRCTVVMRRSRLIDNATGGAQLTQSDFDITNSVFAGNGATGGFGGVFLDRPPTTAVRFAFNTVVDNASGATASFAPGIRCEPLAALPPLHSNLVTGNTGGDGDQVTTPGLCTYEYSLFNPPETGTMNVTGAPLLDAMYRLGAGSPAISAGRSGSGVLEDIDRDVRPADSPDLGADQRP